MAWLLLAAGADCRAAALEYPLGIAVAKDGTMYVADRELHGVWKITDGKAEVLYRGQKRYRTPLYAAFSAALDNDGKLLVGDPGTREVYRFDEDGQPQPLTDGGIGTPLAIAVAASGEIFVGDPEAQRVWKVPAEGGQPEEFAKVIGARGLAFDAAGWLWVVANGGPNQVVRISPDGRQIETVVEGRPFRFPHNIVVADGTAWVTDGYAKGVWKVVPGQKPEAFVSGDPFQNPVGLARHNGKLLVVDSRAKAVFAVSADGNVSRVTD
ncbi:MAG TPA: NHL repeat-containing protein [Planctomycetaceae bacterium]|nr:NHL repeat-containing protein [Planctomycetaceae bacterium]